MGYKFYEYEYTYKKESENNNYFCCFVFMYNIYNNCYCNQFYLYSDQIDAAGIENCQ